MLLGTGTGDPLGTADQLRHRLVPRAVAVGDFNGDGNLDLVTAGQTVDVLPGQRRRHVPGRSAGSGVDPAAIAAADFNGDGKLDVVTADPWRRRVSVLLGRGDGTLTPPIDHAAGTAAHGRGGRATSTATAGRTWRRPTPARATSRSCSTTASGPP